MVLIIINMFDWNWLGFYRINSVYSGWLILEKFRTLNSNNGIGKSPHGNFVVYNDGENINVICLEGIKLWKKWNSIFTVNQIEYTQIIITLTEVSMLMKPLMMKPNFKLSARSFVSWSEN